MVSRLYSKVKVAAGAKIALAKSSALGFQEGFLSRTSARFTGLQKQIDDVFSVTEVKDAQLIVNNVEKEFLEARRLANQVKKELTDVRISLEEARKTLDRCPRDSEHFLKHVTEEHAILNNEKRIRSDYELRELRERELFTEYSNAVRISHEKERQRAQKTKYFSIVASFSGAVVGFLGSSLITYYRLKQIRQMTSPERIITEISNEIKENKLTRQELDKLFEVSTIKLTENLSEKLKILNEEKLHVNSDVSQYANIIDEASKIVNNSKAEMKDFLDDQVSMVSEIFQNDALDIQKSTKDFLDALNNTRSDSALVDLSNQVGSIKDNLLTAFDANLDRIVVETNKIIREECQKIQNDRNELNSQLTNARVSPGENNSSQAVLCGNSSHQGVAEDLSTEVSWYPEANLIVSFFSFALLLYLVATKS